MQLTPTWLLGTRISQGRVFYLPQLLWLENDVRVSSSSWMSQEHMILKLLIGVVVRFKGYMFISTLYDGTGLPLAGFEVIFLNDNLQVLQIGSLWMNPHTKPSKIL
jgi:hypothetical protein